MIQTEKPKYGFVRQQNSFWLDTLWIDFESLKQCKDIFSFNNTTKIKYWMVSY